MDFFPDLIDRSKGPKGKISRTEQHRRHVLEPLSADSQPNLVIHPMKVLSNGMDSRRLLK